jgi:bacillithiol system protein YtxJ
MGWRRLENFAQVGDIVMASAERPQLIFKHSTRCSISAAAKYRLETELAALERIYDVHFLDLIVKRDISSLVAERFEVVHQSPQVIVVENGKATYVATHYDIDAADLLAWRGNKQNNRSA